MLSKQHKLFIMKIISLFSVVRGYNIFIIVLAQYLSAIFILAPEKNSLTILLDFKLFIIVLASSLTIASGYIINNFYDSKKDFINRPNKSMLDRLVSQKTKLNVYFTLNFIVAFLAVFVSWRACLFFSVYIFLIWYYSHRIKKYPIIGNLTAAVLAVLPFFAILLYYKNLYEVIFGHATFLFLLLLIREMIKDLENIKGDLLNDYKTIPIVYGEVISKKIITVLTISTLIPVYVLIEIFDVGYMDIYFYSCLIILIFFLLKLWKSNSKTDYLLLHNILKFLILAGVFCIIFIKPIVLWRGIKLLF
ncbi:geranylgeranylglycerol-phosphate geranylgeranyltransferase [Flavobacterium sp.]|uniref:geranylgeranylglycerol-phosphate geranylgeranyltransferase n=1 Tax=Flavobacterium sp. TaxID=239 RepID=UPI0038FC1E06